MSAWLNPEIHVDKVEPAEGNSSQVRFVCQPTNTVIELPVALPYREGLEDALPPHVWRILADVLHGWYEYARRNGEDRPEGLRDQARFL